MPIWNAANAVLLKRSGEGNTATVLGADDAPLASCDDAGTVRGAEGAPLLTAPVLVPRGMHSGAVGADLKRLQVEADVSAAGGAPAGRLIVRRFTTTPFSKRLTIGLLDSGGNEIGGLAPADKKGRELTVSCAGAQVVRMALVDRDRSLRQTVERWSLDVQDRPAPPADLLVAAVVLRYGKLLAEVTAPDAF